MKSGYVCIKKRVELRNFLFALKKVQTYRFAMWFRMAIVIELQNPQSILLASSSQRIYLAVAPHAAASGAQEEAPGGSRSMLVQQMLQKAGIQKR